MHLQVSVIRGNQFSKDPFISFLLSFFFADSSACILCLNYAVFSMHTYAEIPDIVNSKYKIIFDQLVLIKANQVK